MTQFHEEDRFKLVLTGSVDPSVPLKEVEQRLSKLLKTTLDNIRYLLQGQPTALNKSLFATEAEHYRITIEKTGARCRLEPELTSKPASPVSPPIITPKSSVNPSPAIASAAPMAFSIEPMGLPLAKSTPTTTVCPYCKEAIQHEAVKCKHCGEWLDPTAPPRDADLDDLDPEELKSKGWSAITVCLIAIVLINVIDGIGHLPDFIAAILLFPCIFLYFRGCYRYMKGKGYHVAYAAIGLLSLIGALIMRYMPDKYQNRKYQNRRR